MSEARPKLLVLDGQVQREHPVVDLLREHFDVEVVHQMDRALEVLRSEGPRAVFADAGDFLPLERALVGDKASLVLDTVGEGVCVVDDQGRVTWTNRRMRSFPPEVIEQSRKICLQAQSIFSQTGGGASARTRSKKFTFAASDRYFEMICSPVVGEGLGAGGRGGGGAGGGGEVTQVVAVVWDATSGRRLQSKIDAIDAAGRELAKIDADAIAKLAPSQRLKLLQDKIIRYSRDLMHFDHFAIRVLDRRTDKLEVVIAQGLPPEALEIELYAQPEGNGISGYVASTGRSYICHDTEKDPRYVLGLEHSKSSLTVPLMHFNEVVGVYNVESDQVGAFTEDDRQFAEIFGRSVALALNMLNLLVVERYTTSGKVTDSVVTEMSQPLNDIASEAQALMDDYIGDDSMRDRLRGIAANVEAIRHAIHDVAAGPNVVLGCGRVDAGGEPDPVMADKRVLVADDEMNIRKTIQDVLRKQGAHVTTCKDGYEAIALIEQEGFDLIISDIRMPYRTGYDIFAAAQRFREGTPVVLMTGFGYDPNHSIVRASQEGLSTVLFKPFKVEQLLEETRKALT